MDIKNLNNSAMANRTTENTKPVTKEANANAANPQPAGDQVTLTQVLDQVRSLDDQLKNVNVDNSEKIAQLKAAMNEGTYEVDTKRIAERLMQTEALFAKS